MEHKITRLHGGKNEMGWIQPVCSCGWKGRKEYAYNDWQHTNVKDQERDHLFEVKPKDNKEVRHG